MTRTNFTTSVDADLKEATVIIARRNGITVSEIIEKAFHEFLKENTQEGEVDEAEH